MDFIFLTGIILTQNLAVFLDNLGIFSLIERHNKSNIASSYTKKYQIDFLSRGFLFFTPPLLGFILIQNNLDLLLLSFLFSAIISFLLSSLQSFLFLKKHNFNFNFHKNTRSILILILGLFVFFTHLYVPFYLNIIGFFSSENSLWIVQLSPALTSLSTAFIVYYLDPTIAKFIDSKKNKNIILEMILMRLLGRLSIVILALFLFFTFI